MVIDSTGTVYAIANNDGTVYRYTHSGNTAVGVPFSTTFFASFNDGGHLPPGGGGAHSGLAGDQDGGPQSCYCGGAADVQHQKL